MSRFKDKVALVTGAGGRKNMGRATALRLASEECKVVLTDLAPDDPRASTGKPAADGWRGILSNAEEIKRNGGVAKAIPADLAVRADLEKLVKEATQAFGKVDILVNCAALRQRRWGERVMMTDTPEDEVEQAMRINVMAPFILSKLVVPGMVQRRYGRIVNIASLAGKQALALGGPYSVSKFAVVGLTQTMALELGQFGITVNAVCPGWTDTDRLEANAGLIGSSKSWAEAEAEKKKRDAEWIARNPMRRVTKPEDIANAVAFLASDDAADINGQSLNVCGGVLLS